MLLHSISQRKLQSVLDYDQKSGIFVWKISRRMKGKVAGCLRPDGYIKITINRKHYLAHRLAWLYINGVFPDYIDHVNGNKSDNCLSNLRPATMSENHINRSKRVDNTTGYKGVSLKKDRSKYKAEIGFEGRNIFLGYFSCAEEACLVREAAEITLYGGFSYNN